MRGGYRPGSGRPPVDSFLVQCSIPGPVHAELIRQAKAAGLYHSRLAARLLTAQVLTEAVSRDELAEIITPPGWGASAPG
jgi:hypothetical protein